MSFRQFGGINFAAKNNIISSNYNSLNNLQVTQNLGQSNSYINLLSDISGNLTFNGSETINGTLTATSIDCSNINGDSSNIIQIGENTETINIGTNTEYDGLITIGCSTRDINLNGETTISQNIISNSQTITPVQLGYVSGAQANLQDQITSLQSFPITNLTLAIASHVTLPHGGTIVFVGGNLSKGFYNILLQTNVSINDSTTTLTNISVTITIGTLSYSNTIFNPSYNGTLMANGSNIYNITNFMFYNTGSLSVIQVTYFSQYSGSTASPTLVNPTILNVIKLS